MTRSEFVLENYEQFLTARPSILVTDCKSLCDANPPAGTRNTRVLGSSEPTPEEPLRGGGAQGGSPTRSPIVGSRVSYVQGDATNIIASVWGAVPLAATADICNTVKERFLVQSVTCEIVFQPLHPVTCVPLHESINCHARGTKFTPVFHLQN